MMSKKASRAFLVLLSCASVAQAQEPLATGFSRRDLGAQIAFESFLLDVIRPDSVARWALSLAARPHVAGTPAQVATRDSVIAWHRAAGLDVRYDSLVLYMPQPIRTLVARTFPAPVVFDLSEPPLVEDPVTQGLSVPVFNAYSGAGQVEAEVVFANYGLDADYRTLDSAGVDVEGKIVLALYGRAFRGIKAREAEERGAAALLLYSDPASDGYVRGGVYPDGPMRPPRGVQRGSLLNATGDPSTPHGPSIVGAPRVSEDSMEGVARIPVVPVGYEVAEELLLHMGGAASPDAWEGGLKLTYRLGPGPVRARVESAVETGESAYHPAYNTIAVLPGSVFPDEWVVMGAHRDSWGPGAIDNVSGTASLIEVARAFAAAAARGWLPRRTIVFATWDAEEWGVMGSIEWVEANARRLQSSVVAYVNQDAPVSGSAFGAASSPELKSLAREVPRKVTDPKTGSTVYEAWLELAEARQSGGEPPSDPPVGDLGGGSDHKGFYQHLGIPSIGFGFGGSGGVYHSMYDTPRWMMEYGDPGYRYHAATARIAALAVARLANAEILPYDHAGLAEVVAERVTRFGVAVDDVLHAATATEHAAGEAALEASLDSPEAVALRGAMAQLWGALRMYERDARELEVTRDSILAARRISGSASSAINAELRAASLAFIGEDGLPGDPWSRQLLFASDPDNGYATLPLPGARLALRAGNLEATADRVAELVRHMEKSRAHLGRATELLRAGH